MELDSRHGREAIGVLLFQDIADGAAADRDPALSRPAGELAAHIGYCGVKAIILLSVVLVFRTTVDADLVYAGGAQAFRRTLHAQCPWITLGLAWLSESVGSPWRWAPSWLAC